MSFLVAHSEALDSTLISGNSPLWLKFPPAGFTITGVPTAWTSNLSLAKSDP